MVREAEYKLEHWPLNLTSHVYRVYIRKGGKWEMLGSYPSETVARNVIKDFVRRNTSEYFDEEGQKVENA